MTLIIVAIIETAAILAFFTVKAIERILERRQRAEWAKRMAPRWTEEGYRAGILREPTTLNAGVDISATVTEADVDHWQVGDELVGIPAGSGWVYISASAAERLGIQLPDEGTEHDGCKGD